jgi:hypothetical protein
MNTGHLGSSPDPSVADRDVDRRDGGFIVITFGLLLIPIIIFTALAVDVSSWYSRATELQRTADSAALAGVVWMPDFGKASDNAAPVLKKNGVVDGAGNMAVTMSVGETGITSFKVCVTDNKVTQFFGAVFASPTKMTRCGTAQYNAPLQLGSPLNYFGGNHDSITQYIAGETPANPVTIPSRSVFGNGTWRNFCNVRASYPSGQIVGYWYRGGSDDPDDWYYALGVHTSAANFPNCNTPPLAVPDVESFSGSYVYCNLLGGRWERFGGTDGAVRRYWVDGARSQYPDCGFNGSARQPIPKEKSPNMWAAIESYNYSHANGDAYSNKGAEYRSTGYWYSIDIPDAGVNGGNVSIQAWDLTYNCQLGCRSPEGDVSGPMPVRMRVFKAGTLKYDMSGITPVSGCDTGWLDGSVAGYDQQWKVVCTINTASPGNRYYIQVQSTEIVGNGTTPTYGADGRGVTGYAVRAVSGMFPAACLEYLPVGDVACYGSGTQPRLSAYGDMEMYNGINSGQPTQFYLADVTPSYGGKTLEIKLFDPGDGAGTSWVTIRGPSSSTTAGQMVPSSACSVQYRNYGASSWNNVSLSNGPDGNYPNTCTVQTTTGSTNTYQDRWLRFRITLPTDYGPTGSANWTNCDPNVADPVNDPGSCWWQISYYVDSGKLDDYTTWSAGIINDPVRLVR